MSTLNQHSLPLVFDRWLVFAVCLLLAIGLLMVGSASVVISGRVYGHPFHYVWHQAAYLLVGIFAAVAVMRIELAQWQRAGGLLLILCLLILVAILIPGLGHRVNGSIRWLGIGPFGIQASEFAKLAVIIYLAGYLVRRDVEVRTRLRGFLKPLIILSIIALLLLKEPDFGAASVIIATAIGMMFLAGVRLWQFAVLLSSVIIALGILALSSPYRVARLTSFLNPWADQFNSGYQLTQSLIAFGRGGWFGVGLGDSVQKLFYLPEAHTDFLLAVIAEEWGIMGVLLVITLFGIVVARALRMGRMAYCQHKFFAAYLAYGIGLWLGIQALINMGVNAGLLPTKGLTLPLLSYGGNSLLMACIAVALLLRIDYELRAIPSNSHFQRELLFY